MNELQEAGEILTFYLGLLLLFTSLSHFDKLPGK